MESGNLFTRDDTFFGVCAGLGEDFGFSPALIRAPLAVLVLWNPAALLAIYAGLGAIVLVSRLAFPVPRAVLSAAAPVEADAEAAASAGEEPVLLAA